MPTKVFSVSLGYGATCDFVRVGNLVMALTNASFTSYPGTGEEVLPDLLPEGIRPIKKIIIIGNEINPVEGPTSPNYFLGNPIWMITDDGTITLQGHGAWAGWHFNISAVWITNDDWPS